VTPRSRAARMAAVAAAAGILLIGIPSPASAAGPSKNLLAATTQSQCTASTRVPETPAALSSLQSSSAWPLTRGAGVTVAVVDSGVAANPHLDGTDGAGRTDNYAHGTVIAGQIAAQPISGSGVEGLAPDAKILPVRVYAGTEKQLVEAGFGPNTARLAEGIRYAADQGAQIINVSISTSEKNATLADAVAYAQQRGSLVVASAGNRTNNDSPEQDDKDGARYPAGFSGVIGVAAVGSEGVVTKASIHGPHVSLSAPGQAIASSWPLGGDCVVGADDPATSWATAYVSAAAALVASAHPSETPAQWAYRLEATAVRAQPDTRSNISGWGVVQPYDAIVMVPGTGLRGPKSPFVAANPSASPSASPEAVAVVIGPGPDAAAITTATGIGVAGVIALGAIGALAIYVSRRREETAPRRAAPTGRGLYGPEEQE